MTPPADQPYAAFVLAMYLDLPDTPLRTTPQDHHFARRLEQQAVPQSLVESALLLASLRRMVRPVGLPPLSPIRSLAYFRPVIAELQQQPLPDGYLEYLRRKLRLALCRSANPVQKTTFSDDR